MRAGRVEEAAAIAKRIRAVIYQTHPVRLRRYDTRRNVSETWSKVREVTRGRCNNRDAELESSLTDDALNRQYADISTDQGPDFQNILR